ncbi:MAG: hypothetical protein MUE51_03090, partial [Thermoleophilia bacterium]|nr:hypothetical protein [Thermoleophilia bacterium]
MESDEDRPVDGPGGAPRRRWTSPRVLVPAGVVVAAVGTGAIVLGLRAGGGGAETPTPPPPVAPTLISRPVGRDAPIALAGGDGTVRIGVRAEIPAGPSPARLRSAPVGAPVTVTVDLRRAGLADEATPRLVAERVIMSESRERAIEALPLASGQVILVNRTTGDVVAPDVGTGGSHADHVPGRSLAAVSGSADLWAAQAPPDTAALALDDSGSLMAASVPGAGEVGTVDLIDHRAGPTSATGGRPGGVRFDERDRVWASDLDSGIVRIVDPATGRQVGQVDGVAAPALVAMAPTAGRALVLGRDGAAVLVDTATLEVVERARFAGRPTALAWAPGTRSFVAVVQEGGLEAVRLTRAGRLTGGSGLPLPELRGAPTAVGVGRDGRTAVVLARDADRLAVVDLRARRVMRAIDTGSRPSSMAFMDRFAVVQNAGSADVTWIDLTTPERSA